MTPRLHFIGLVVADMGKALQFYRRLGLTIPADADNEPHVDVPLPGGLLLVFDTIDVVRSFEPNWTKPQGSPQMGLAFECGDPAEVDRVFADLVAAGYEGHHVPWDAFWGQRYATVRDPDGNGVDLFAPLTPAS